MKRAIKLKDNLVSLTADKIKGTKSFIIFEYAGLTAEEMSKLRKEMLQTNASLIVLKNNILSRALTKASIKEFGDLTGPNAIAFAGDDEIAPLKAICKLLKDNDFIKIKGSYIEAKYMDVELTKQIASLPSREGMYSMLLSVLTAPVRNLLYGLKAVADTKSA